jgi:hypothetical protein
VVTGGAVADPTPLRGAVNDLADLDAHPGDAGRRADLEDVPLQIPEPRADDVGPADLLGVAPLRSLVDPQGDDPAHGAVGAALADGLPRPAPDGHAAARSPAQVSSRTNWIVRSGAVSGRRSGGTPSLTG